MFASLFSYVQSPKSLLASKLAGALTVYFHVDPKLIESNLLSDTKIVLNQVRLKPQRLGIAAQLIGTIDAIEFSWKWGGSSDGTTSFIREAVLSIRGAKLEIAQADRAADAPRGSEYDLKLSTSSNSSTTFPGYLDSYVQQIIDHLTLTITDVEVVVGTYSESSGKLVIEVNAIQLLTLGRQTEREYEGVIDETGNSGGADAVAFSVLSHLAQRMSFESLSAYVLVDEKADHKIPLLEAMSYAATVKRVSGRRFLNFMTGLEILGDLHGDSCVLHLGSTQVKVLAEVFRELLDVGSLLSSEMCGSHPHEPATAETEPVVQEPVVEETASLFVFPLPTLILRLPNGSVIHMPHCEVRYCMDGSTFVLVGSDGILVEHEKPLLQLSDDACWCFDVAARSFTISRVCPHSILEESNLDGNVPASTIAHLHLEETSVKHLIEGLHEVERTYHDVMESAFDKCVGLTATRPSSPWSIDVQGEVTFLASGEDHEWVRATVSSPALVVSSPKVLGESPNIKFEMASAQLGPTSFGVCTVSVPDTALDVRSNQLCVFGRVEGKIQSLDIVEKLQRFVVRLMECIVLPCSNEPGSQGSDVVVPMSIKIPFANILLFEPRHLNVQAEDCFFDQSGSVRIESLQWCDDKTDSMAGSTRGIALKTAGGISARIDQIEAFCVPRMFTLTKPTTNVKIEFKGGLLDLQLTKIRTLLLVNMKDPEEREETTVSTSIPPLPFRIRTRVEDLTVVTKPIDQCRTPTILSIQSLDVEAASSRNGSLSLKNHQSMACLIQVKNDQRLRVRVEPTSVVLSSVLDVIQCNSLGLYIQYASVGKLKIRVPPFSVESAKCRCDSSIVVSVDQSSTVVTALRLIDEVKCMSDGSKSTGTAATMPFPFAVEVPTVEITMSHPLTELTCTDTQMVGRSVRLGTVAINGPEGSSGLCHGVYCNFEDETLVHVEQIKSLRWPGFFSIGAPILNTRVVSNGNTFCVNLSTCCFVVDALRSLTEREPTSIADTKCLTGTLAIDVKIESLVVRALDSDDAEATVSLRPIHVEVSSSDENLSMKTTVPVNARFATTSELWLDTRIGVTTVIIDKELMELKSLNCSMIHVGPSSFGDISLDFPCFHMSSYATGPIVIFEGPLSGAIQSFELANSIHDMLQRHRGLFVPTSTDRLDSTRSTSTQFPAIDIVVIDLGARVQLSDGRLDVVSGAFCCAHSMYVISDGTSMSVTGLSGCLGTAITARAEFVDSLYAPGALSLQKPIRDITLALSQETGLFVSAESASFLMLDSCRERKPSMTDCFVLPFQVTCKLQDLHLSVNDDSDYFRAKGISIQFKPAPAPPVALVFDVQIDALESNVATVCGSCLSGLYCGGNTISDLVVQVDSSVVTVGFSSEDWKRVMKQGRDDGDEIVWYLPHASVSPFTASTVYRGKVVSTKTSLRFSQFAGGPETTLNDIAYHLKLEALRQMPSFLAGAEVLGESVIDLTAKGAGRLALGTSLKGSVAGSVGGLVVSDSIRGAISHGKQARGASREESYRIGDFTKGSIRAIQETARLTREREGRDSYRFGDFTKGAIRGSGNYAKDNKSRLGAAGGSSVGMVVGCAMLGPVGLIAGSIIGAKAGARVTGDDQNQVGASPRDMSEAQCDADLLGLGPEPCDMQTSQAVQSDPFDPFSSVPQQSLHPKSRGSQSEPVSPETYQTAIESKRGTRSYGSIPYGQTPATTSSHLAYSEVETPESHQRSSTPRSTSTDDLFGLGTTRYCPASNTVPVVHSTQTPVWPSAIPRPTQHIPMHPQGRSNQQSQALPLDYQQQSQEVTRSPHPQYPPLHGLSHSSRMQTKPEVPSQSEERGYQFGDITRSIVSKGKQKSGRSENDSYKFGDFTRGLFGK